MMRSKYFKNFSLFAMIAMAVLPLSHARAADDLGTPSYAGPSAGFDRGMDRYRDTRATQQRNEILQQRSTLQRDLNNTGVDRNLEQRSMKIQNDIQYQRERAIQAQQDFIYRQNRNKARVND
ncbi:MAG: hypothetical protein DI551_03925 [Micavibrio aeruginosavorus]|uniref:Uncharacterized protein n=1 Tax=Micavibrio aeruginosavorus TaxID=349221 RepID=A0A2W5N3Y1_9BACT|nr:MAG: hypothetical protein DI551_03925 [Micavibrio aeruginosavorus]